MVSSPPMGRGKTPDMRPFFPLAHSSDRFPLPLIVNEAFPNLLVCMSRVNNDGKLASQWRSNCFFCYTTFVASCSLPLTVIIFPAQDYVISSRTCFVTTLSLSTVLLHSEWKLSVARIKCSGTICHFLLRLATWEMHSLINEQKTTTKSVYHWLLAVGTQNFLWCF